MTKSRHINKPRHFWTEAERDRLRELYPDMRAQDVAQIMGLGVGQIYRMAISLGIEKSEAFKASDKSGRVARGRQHPSMIASQFKPGITPWNKGTHYVAGGRSAETRFKKGSMSGAAQHNYVPIGSLRISKDGYLQRKMTDDQSLVPTRRWEAVHRIVWMAVHGSIPRGQIVVFKPGMKTVNEQEITIDRLECITRAENAKRNAPWTKEPEIGYLYRLKGAITRQVNRIAKEAA